MSVTFELQRYEAEIAGPDNAAETAAPHGYDTYDADADLAALDFAVPPDEFASEVGDDPVPPLLSSVEAAEAISPDLVRDYLRRIGRVPLLGAAQEVALAKRIEAGLYAEQLISAFAGEGGTRHGKWLTVDVAGQSGERENVATRQELQWIAADGKRAKDAMLEANLRLVASLARHYSGRGMALPDLIQEGNLGLIRAVEKFDHTRGIKFSTYATWCIRRAITRGLADQARAIRAPVHRVEDLNRLKRASRDLMRDLGREPTTEELAAALGLDIGHVRELGQIERIQPTSYDAPAGDGTGRDRAGTPLIALLPDMRVPDPADEVVTRTQIELLYGALRLLTDREQLLITLRYGLIDGRERTLEEIGEVLGVTRQRVQQIEKIVRGKLRALIMAE